MLNPLSDSVKKMFSRQKMRYLAARLWQEIAGVAQDYWKDGHWEKAERPDKGAAPEKPAKAKSPSFRERLKQTSSGDDAAGPGKGEWHAEPGEISEKMWGQGFLAPGDDYLTDRLIRPLGLNKDMSVLDLSAGLGGRVRKVMEEFGIYVTGLELDKEIAERAARMAVMRGDSKQAVVASYDPAHFSVSRIYDCVIAREVIYRVADKNAFVKEVAAACKPRAQISFTDYIVNPEVRDRPAIGAWRAFEKGANPLGLVEMAELWAKVGISLRVHDDQTAYYKEEVKNGLERFARLMASGLVPDRDTKIAIKKHVMTWALRMAAMNAGMKFYRFYGMR